jgi:hypothetical protein
MLAISAAAGGLAVNSGFGRASAQMAARIEPFVPDLEKIISVAEPIRALAAGFGNDLGNTEGPVWWKEGGYQRIQGAS